MRNAEFGSYVPSAVFREGKDALPGRECHEDLAVLDPADGFRILAARGITLKSGQKLKIPAEEQKFLMAELPHHHRVAILTGHGVLILCGELLSATGLLPVWLPEGDAGMIVRCLAYLERRDLVCSPRLSAVTAKDGSPETYYNMLIDQFDACDRMFHPDADTDFRLHCAQIAWFAGCRVNVTSLPVGQLPITPTDRMRWSAFLLCTFLALRGDSFSGPKLQLDPAPSKTVHLQLLHTSERVRQDPLTDPRFDYLRLPCFSSFKLTATDRGLILETLLHRASGEPAQVWASSKDEPELFRMEIVGY